MESASDADGTEIAIGARSAIVNDVENVAKHEANAEANQIGAQTAIVNDAKNVAQHEVSTEANATKKNAKTDAGKIVVNVAESKSGAANTPVNENVYVEASCFEGS